MPKPDKTQETDTEEIPQPEPLGGGTKKPA